ncbi:hypothetical protein Tco_0747430 [Tanacetum coccineum]|uniref:Uncharacterized protein n=1 Tax=Tanacetum coccineum TaxID=301880 RepID=A0ABQ4YSQ3_9ASTR
MGSFIKWYCRQIGKSKLSKADLEGPAYKIDLVNPEGNRIMPDVAKGSNIQSLAGRDDLVMLWNLVKERFSSTEPTDDKERTLWVELKRVHHVSTERGIDIFMLVEKEYPLSKGVLTLMLVNRLLVEQHSEMANELLRKIFIQANRPRQ